MPHCESQFLIEKIGELVPQPIVIRVNDNQSTFLSVRSGKNLRVSIHRIFAHAPYDVLKAVASFIQGEKRTTKACIQSFIRQNAHLVSSADHLIDLHPEGDTRDLRPLFDRLNEIYFQEKLSISLTWFGNKVPRNIARCTLGLYFDTLKLIKIHSLLDREEVPGYVLESVLFHEMLHAVCSGTMNKKGIAISHNPEFRKREREFCHYEKAERWIRENRHYFFKRRS